MAIQGFCPPSPSPSHSPPSHSPPSPYYQLLERGSARLGRVKKRMKNKTGNLFNLQRVPVCSLVLLLLTDSPNSSIFLGLKKHPKLEITLMGLPFSKLSKYSADQTNIS